MRLKKILLALVAVLCFVMTDVAAKPNNRVVKPSKRAAEEVIRRFVGDSIRLRLSTKLDRSSDGCYYEATLKNGRVHIEGSTPVALCKGFYDLVRQQGAGMDSWAGRRFDATRWGDGTRTITAVSPYAHHYIFNVCTYGYTMAYWDEERWDEEIDRMALHGLDMPLMLIAQEAIMTRVFARIGLSDEEIQRYFGGPAHLPWQRMGCISSVDGPLTASWHEGQLKLAHHVMDRMRSLGMTPICPAFAGFVPQSITRVLPDIKIYEMSWGGAFHNWMVTPEQPLFKELGTMFIEEWQKEFGKCDYYLADSFNEMDLPFAPHGSPERYRQLAGYGKAVYESITAAAPDAVWVMQGWMFGFQRHIWDKASLDALISDVPTEKMLLLDLAVDYNYHFWHNGNNWDFYQGYNGKPWVFSVIPNMGGKTAYTGILDFYANGRLEALHSANKGNLVGYGLAPEGLETNDLIYELVCDGGWTGDSIHLDDWLTNYQQCRYGKQLVPNKCWRDIYSKFTDHPRFFWQFRPGNGWRGSVGCSKESALWLAQAEEADTPLARADYAENVMMVKGAYIEQLLEEANTLLDQGRLVEADRSVENAFAMMREVDTLLRECLPGRTLDSWLNFAHKAATNEEEWASYDRNARRILTIWGPPVDDYSARLWGGLIGEYYLPRWQKWYSLRRQGKSSKEVAGVLAEWERQWVEKGGNAE